MAGEIPGLITARGFNLNPCAVQDPDTISDPAKPVPDWRPVPSSRVRIHSFPNGNGRLARLATDLRINPGEYVGVEGQLEGGESGR